MLAAPPLSGIAGAPAGGECLVLFTSGSTSLPKAVPHMQRGLMWSCEMKYCVDPSPWLAPHAASLSFLPTYHIIGFVNNFLFNLYAGARCLVYTDPGTPMTASTVVAGVAALHQEEQAAEAALRASLLRHQLDELRAQLGSRGQELATARKLIQKPTQLEREIADVSAERDKVSRHPSLTRATAAVPSHMLPRACAHMPPRS